MFQYKVMPFGLKNAPAIFQRMIDMVLGSLIGKCCVTYLDDILIFSPNKAQHELDLLSIFNCLNKFNLKLKISKCEFYKSELKFLGNIILKKGISICPDRTLVITKFVSPKNKPQF